MDALSARVITTVDWRSDFAAWLAEDGRSANTISSYLSDAGRYSAWFEQINGQPFSPELLTGVDLRAYRAHSLNQERVKPATWNRRRISLAMFCRWARDLELVAYDPFQGVQPAEEVELAPRWLDQADVNRLLRQAERMVNTAATAHWRRQAARDQAMIALMLRAGLRVGEVVSLDARDIEIGQRSGRVIIRSGKGGKRREIPLSIEARRSLAFWLELRQASQPDEPLFNGKSGERLTRRQVERRITEIGRLAGIELTPHQLRHTFVKSALDRGAQMIYVQKLAGHARAETTARYGTPGWSDLEQAVENA